MLINGYRCMWVIVLFDLPTETKRARKDYAEFRKMLLNNGFAQMQYSVYLRNCPSHENARVHITRVEAHLPPDGEVRILTITDKQFERMRIFWGKMRQPVEPAACQLNLF